VNSVPINGPSDIGMRAEEAMKLLENYPAIGFPIGYRNTASVGDKISSVFTRCIGYIPFVGSEVAWKEYETKLYVEGRIREIRAEDSSFLDPTIGKDLEKWSQQMENRWLIDSFGLSFIYFPVDVFVTFFKAFSN
jgi:hypothetical protein